MGSGAHNSFEGPLAGLIALVVVALAILVIPPPAFPDSFVFFATLAGITGLSAVIGQMFASILLPRSTAWAPALRRLDSYLITAPIWFAISLALGL